MKDVGDDHIEEKRSSILESDEYNPFIPEFRVQQS